MAIANHTPKKEAGNALLMSNHCPGLLFARHHRENETETGKRRPGDELSLKT